MTAETRFHKHWHVKVVSGSRAHRLFKAVLQRPIRTVDFETASKSRFVYGAETMDSKVWTLTMLGVLHALTGMTLLIKEPWDLLPDVPEEIGDPRWHWDGLTKKDAWCAWPCDRCGVRRDEHADQNIPHLLSVWDIADHKFKA